MATAAMAAPQQFPAGSNSSGGGKSEEQRLPMPSRNPLPLSASQEAQVREIFNERVRKLCADEIQGK